MLDPPPPWTQALSDDQLPPGLLVVSVVPPTMVIYGLVVGRGGPHVVQYAPLSPEAWKNDCPCAANCWKIWSWSAAGEPDQVQEELSWLAAGWPTPLVSVAMRFSRSVGFEVPPAS